MSHFDRLDNFGWERLPMRTGGAADDNVYRADEDHEGQEPQADEGDFDDFQFCGLEVLSDVNVVKQASGGYILRPKSTAEAAATLAAWNLPAPHDAQAAPPNPNLPVTQFELSSWSSTPRCVRL